jgi:hypothetical protein
MVTLLIGAGILGGVSVACEGKSVDKFFGLNYRVQNSQQLA